MILDLDRLTIVAGGLTYKLVRVEEPKPKRTIGERIRAYREAAGLTVQQLAEKTECPLSTMQQMEAGPSFDIHPNFLGRLAKELGIEVRCLTEDVPTSIQIGATT